MDTSVLKLGDVLGDALIDLLDHLIGLRLVLLRLSQAGSGLVVLGDGVLDVRVDLLLAGGHGLAQHWREEVEEPSDEDGDVDEVGLRDVQVQGKSPAQLHLPKVQQAALRLLRHGRRGAGRQAGQAGHAGHAGRRSQHWLRWEEGGGAPQRQDDGPHGQGDLASHGCRVRGELAVRTLRTQGAGAAAQAQAVGRQPVVKPKPWTKPGNPHSS